MTLPYLDIEVIRFPTYLTAMADEIRKSRSGERSRLRLLAAAARLLETIHYRDLLVEQVCQEAGVAKGTFYIYFKSKDEFLRELARRYVSFEVQTYPRLSSKSTPFTNTRRWVYWYEKTFAANVGVMKCMVQMGTQDEEMRQIWHERNGRLVDRSLIGWMKTRPDSDPKLERFILRTAGTMMDQSLFERYGVQTGQGVEDPHDPEFIVDLHAFMNFRAMYGHNPPAEEFSADSPFRKLIEQDAAA
ncbi:MAG: TetR family transcriptional regulator [Phenylobacterium sp.]|uniref:TetR/AcrR family transcriptional regulator n=1 Tax=Phenylobacterium sp. TaxID=1871053 RepID=UPI0025DF1102|nr:TetR/AcrR family transcriptional regulator [Phenylobacterium sp.]MBI1197795.1 TetR family transcriptional regulator [Phenylobacterium sp.]